MSADAAHACICTLLFGATASKLALPIALAVVAQWLFGFLWFGLIMKNPYMRSMAVDKGVKAAAFIRQLYPMPVMVVSTLAAGLARAAGIVAVMNHATSQNAKASSLCMYSQAATAVWLLMAVPSIECSLWAQRPTTLMVVTNGFNLGCALLAAVVLYFSAAYKL